MKEYPEYDMEELIPIVAEQAQKYGGWEHTSVSYEKARQLMEGVMYCLKEYQTCVKNGLEDQSLSVKEQYRIGKQAVVRKAEEVRCIYNEMIPRFDHYGVLCLKDTVEKGIPEFLKWYDTKFFPQETILTLDYPLMAKLFGIKGVDAIHVYVKGIRTEQKFLQKLDRNFVLEILNRAIPEYQQMLDNICEPVLLNVLGHMELHKPLRKGGFSFQEREMLAKRLGGNREKEIENILHGAVTQLVTEAYEGDAEMLEYFLKALPDMAVRVETACKIGHPERIFVW